MKKISRKLGFVVILALVMCMSVAAAGYSDKTLDINYNGGIDTYNSNASTFVPEDSAWTSSLYDFYTYNDNALAKALDALSVTKDGKNPTKWVFTDHTNNTPFDLTETSRRADEFGTLQLMAIWEAISTGGGVAGDPESFISDAIQTVDIFPADEKLTYVQGSGKDVTFFFPEADIEQFSGYGLNFETTAKYNVDYTVSAGENGVFLTLKASYLDTLEKGNNTPILFFTRNNPNPSGGIGLADLTVK
ncbi:MAG: hypothetical protein E7334_10125 [Clostridiales bacterium]|nr:hypothetical protein [Clostridiales bacterium]